jgi:hypothetical protein
MDNISMLRVVWLKLVYHGLATTTRTQKDAYQNTRSLVLICHSSKRQLHQALIFGKKFTQEI